MLLYVGVAAGIGDRVPALSTLERTLGGGVQVLTLFGAALCSFAVATPVVREHRGVPVARPSLGPGAAALAFALVAWLLPREAPALCRAGLLLVATGNVLVGGAQRYSAAASRIRRHPMFSYAEADFQARGRSRSEEERFLAPRTAMMVPFLLVPVWPSALDVLGGDGALWPAIVAAYLAGLPAILFDAKHGSLRFGLASAGVAVALLSLHRIATPHPTVALEAALIVLAYPAASALLVRGRQRLAGQAFAVLLLSRLVVDVPALEHVPIIEASFLALLTAAAFALRATPTALD